MKRNWASIRTLVTKVFSLLLLVGLVACTKKEPSNSSANQGFQTNETHNQNSNANRQRNKVGNLKRDLNAALTEGDRTHPYAREISIFRQMSRIYQEAWFVAINDKRTFVKNVFEKAASDLSKLKERQLGFPLPYLQWINQKNGEVEIRYNFGNISQFINIRALLIRAFSPRCNIMFDSDNRLQKLTCEEIGQNLIPSTSVDLLFDKLQFKGSSKFLLQASGRLLDLESELEKIEFKVKYNVNYVTVVKTNLKKPTSQPLAPQPVSQPVAQPTQLKDATKEQAPNSQKAQSQSEPQFKNPEQPSPELQSHLQQNPNEETPELPAQTPEQITEAHEFQQDPSSEGVMSPQGEVTPHGESFQESEVAPQGEVSTSPESSTIN